MEEQELVLEESVSETIEETVEEPVEDTIEETVEEPVEETVEELVEDVNENQDEEGRPFDDDTPDLPPTGPALYIATSSIASPSDADVLLSTIHHDIELMHFTILSLFCIVFVYVMIVRRFKK